MFENAELGHKIDKATFEEESPRVRADLLEAQRQLAAADALLIVEVTDVQGRTDYTASQERLTPRMGKPPAKPLEPSRLRYFPAIPGAGNDPLVFAVGEALLRRVVGTKSDRQYKEALDRYNCETLPRWQQQVDEYYARYRTRPIAWRQEILAKGTATVSGSLRLVDLADGLVLWEAPFSASDRDESSYETRTVTSTGEDSSPEPVPYPAASSEPPDALVARAAESALAEGVQALRGTALLPPPTTTVNTALGPASLAPAPDAPAPAPPGRVLDVDGDTLLIGLGATDGLRLNDTLVVTLEDGRRVRAVVTRVRPRTCDAAFDKDAPADLRALIAIGQTAQREGTREMAQ